MDVWFLKNIKPIQIILQKKSCQPIFKQLIYKILKNYNLNKKSRLFFTSQFTAQFFCNFSTYRTINVVVQPETMKKYSTIRRIETSFPVSVKPC